MAVSKHVFVNFSAQFVVIAVHYPKSFCPSIWLIIDGQYVQLAFAVIIVANRTKHIGLNWLKFGEFVNCFLFILCWICPSF